MITVEEAMERILGYVEVLEPEEKPLLEALGQVLAEDVASTFDIPPLDNTAMDGYAVRAKDTRGASSDSPVQLQVVGEVAAGYVFRGEVRPGTAVRIMTGAPVPAGADAIVPFEETGEPFRKAPGRAPARVIRRPVVAILSTGDELVEAGQSKPPAKIYDANAHSVGALVRRHGGGPRLVGLAQGT